MGKCVFCEKEFNTANALRNHERLCKDNPSRQILSCWANSGKRGKPGGNQYTAGTAKPISDETRKKMSESAKNQVWDSDRKSRHSKLMKEVVMKSPKSYSAENVCGRVKLVEYNGERFHGEWEVEVAKWFDGNNIRWEREVKPIPYEWNNGWHLYFPDFYLPDLDLYVEVKGYETDRDRSKWSVVPNLVVIKQKDIKAIRSNTFDGLVV